MRTLTTLMLLCLAACGDKDRGTVTFGDDTGDSAAAVDSDGDGYLARDDCDDNDAAVNPGAEEICDGIDNNCDDRTDEAAATDASTWYADSDGDGYGDTGDSTQACEQPEGYVANADDCDDGDANFHPGASENDCADPNDYNCDGSVGYEDGDGDGFPACEECDDRNADVNPGASEADAECNEIDNDCDGEVDEGLLNTFYVDEDGDEYGDDDFTTEACDQPEGYAAESGDCDETDPSINPGAAEICDDIDNDCDGDIDDADTSLETDNVWYADNDGDGYGGGSYSIAACEQPSNTTSVADDCDDTDAYTYPGAAANDSTTDCMTDEDSDGYGSDSPATGVTAGTDCNDSETGINPGVNEFSYDSEDQDCDGTEPRYTWYVDRYAGEVWRLDLDTQTWTLIASGLGDLLYVTHDVENNVLYVTETSTGQIVKIELPDQGAVDPSTVTVTRPFTTTFTLPGGIEFDSSTGNLVVGDITDDVVYLFDPSADTKSAMCSVDTPVGITVVGSGIYGVAARGDNALVECSSSSTSVTTRYSMSEPNGIAYDGGSYYGASYEDGWVDRDDGTRVFSGISSTYTKDMGVSPDLTELLVVESNGTNDNTANGVWIIPNDGTAYTTTSSGVIFASGGPGNPFGMDNNAP